MTDDSGPAAMPPRGSRGASVRLPDGAQQYAGGWRVRDTTGLATASVATCALVAMFTIVNILSAAPAMRAADTTASRSVIESTFFATAVAALVTAVAAWVVTCLWLMAARENLEVLAPSRRHRHVTPWVWWGWIVPIVCLWVRFQVVRDLHKKSRPGAQVRLVGWWWAAYLVMLSLENFQASLLDDPGATGTVEVLGIVLSVITMVALALWALIVRDVVRAQADPTIER